MTSRRMTAAAVLAVCVAAPTWSAATAMAAPQSAPTAATRLASLTGVEASITAGAGSAQSWNSRARQRSSLEGAVAATLNKATTTSPYLGKYLSGLVIDLESGQTIWSHQASVRRLPASSQKVVTALAVLNSADTNSRLVTRVFQNNQAPNELVLSSEGDPSLGATRLKAGAAVVAARLLEQGLTTVQLSVDSSYFPEPTPAYGWKSSYLRSEVQLVRGVALAGYRGSDASMAAGRVLAGYLKPLGVTATVVGRQVVPADARELFSTNSATIGQMVQRMLSESNNDYAEFLLRHAAKARGASTTTNGTVEFLTRSLAEQGVPTSGFLGYDGSGLSRADRMPPQTLAAAVTKLYTNSTTRSIAFAPWAMPRAGQTGTLAGRYKASAQQCAKGKVLAKTGTLSDVNALAGIARGVDGRDRVFVLLDNGPTKTSSVRYALDTLATTAVGCRL